MKLNPDVKTSMSFNLNLNNHSRHYQVSLILKAQNPMLILYSVKAFSLLTHQ